MLEGDKAAGTNPVLTRQPRAGRRRIKQGEKLLNVQHRALEVKGAVAM